MSRRLPALACASAALLATACSESTGRVIPPPSPSATLERIVLTPATAMLAKGSTLAMSARAFYSDGKSEDVTREATWASSDPAIATVTPEGGVTAVRVGTIELRATVEATVGTAAISVTTAPLTALAIEPRSTTLDVRETATLTARGTFADASSEDVTARVEWATSSATVATVSQGVVTAVAGGTVWIGVRDGATGLTDRVTVTVRPRVPTSVVLTPTGVSLAVGRTQAFTATARFADGAEEDATRTVLWSTSNPAVATVTAGGVASAIAEGITSITASYPGGPRGSTTLSVTPPALEILEVTPATATIASGQTQTYRAEGRYSNGTIRDLTFVVMWSSSDTAVAVLSRNVASPVGAGTATISATEPASGTRTDARLVVLPPALTGIVITPNAITVPFGATQAFQAFGLYSDNTSADITATVQWTSSQPAVATIAAGGLASSVSQGVTVIDAVDPASGVSSAQTVNGSATMTVSPPALLSIRVAPATWTTVVGAVQAFTATGHYSDGNDVDVTNAVTWRSTSAAVTIGAGGVATAASAGSATIIATDPATMVSSEASNQSARASVTIAQLASISLTPTSTSVPAGAEARVRATGHYNNGATADLTDQVTWSVVTTSVANILNDAGLRGRVVRTRPGATRVVALEPGSGISSGPAARVVVTAAPALSALGIVPSSALVAIGRTVPLRARGRFADGSAHDMTNTVDWTSANPARATVGNTDGTRGRVTGVTVGLTTVSAVYAITGMAAPPAAITVELGIVTLGRTWMGLVEIDSTPSFGVDVGQVTFVAGDFGPAAVVSDVNVTINFLKTDGSCAVPASGNAFHNETNFALRGPGGLQVALAPSGTWSGATAIAPVTVVFDDTAAGPPSGIPINGTFTPSAPLSAFNGSSPLGDWTLQAGDSAGGDPLCVYSFTVTVTAQ